MKRKEIVVIHPTLGNLLYGSMAAAGKDFGLTASQVRRLIETDRPYLGAYFDWRL